MDRPSWVTPLMAGNITTEDWEVASRKVWELRMQYPPDSLSAIFRDIAIRLQAEVDRLQRTALARSQQNLRQENGMSEETLAQRAARLEIERDGVSEMLKEAIHEKEEKVAHVQRLLVAARDERDELRKIVNVKRMVDRFLGWKLPENFNPDGGISFKRTRNENTPWPAKNEPVGTNLFDATQAEEMVRYMLADAQGSVTEQSQQNSRQDGEA